MLYDIFGMFYEWSWFKAVAICVAVQGTMADFSSYFVFKFLQYYICIVSAVLHVGRALFSFSPTVS